MVAEILAPRGPGSQHVEADARGDGGQPAAEVGHAAGIDAGEAEPGLLDGVVGFDGGAEQATPLYVVYQRLWAFSAETVTVIFAVYVLGLLASLLAFGTLSDRVGRRPVLLSALVLEGLAMALFLAAGGVSALLVARAIQGVATGLALPALGAALVDLEPARRPGLAATVNGVVPIAGLGAGSLACGALVEYGPDPTRLVWALLLGGVLVTVPVIVLLPESGVRRAIRRAGARSLAPRLRLSSLGLPSLGLPSLGLPRALRRDFAALVPLIVASWTLGGLYLSLGPSIANTVFGIGNHLVGGLVATLLCATGATTAFALRRATGVAVRRLSAALLAGGTAVTLLGTLTHTLATAVVGTVLAGTGYGLSGLATFGAMSRLIAVPTGGGGGSLGADARGQLFATGFTIAYLAFSVPALLAGYAATHVGLHITVAAYSVCVIFVALTALILPAARPSTPGSRQSAPG